MKFYKYILIVLFFSSSLFSNIIDVSTIKNKISLLPKSSLYDDNSLLLNFEDIKKQKFKKNSKDIINYGINSTKTIWIKFILKNNTKQNKELILEYDSSITKNIELYTRDKIYKDGVMNINKKRVSLRPTFTLNIRANTKNTYYLKSSSNHSSLLLKLNLWEKNKFYKKNLKQNSFTNVFFGAMTILLIYNLFIYIFIKDKIYLYYSSYIFFMSIYSSLYIGYSTLYIFNQETINFLINNRFILVYLVIVSITLFSSSLLNFKKYSNFNKIINIYISILSLLAILSFNSSIFNSGFAVFFLPLLILLIFQSLFILVKTKNILFLIYFIAWCPMLILSFGWIYLGIKGGAISEVYDNFIYILMIAILFEATTFAISLAYRIKILQNKKEEAVRQFIEEKKNIEKNLRIEVSKKTKDLHLSLEEKELLLKELHHRIKNNLQMIISLLRLQNFKIKDTKIKAILIDTQNRIKSIAFLHELLYKQDNISYISTYKYFKFLINELLTTTNIDIKVNYEINCDIPLKDIIYCGLIVNELISNSIKYAFKKEGKIDILLNKKNNLYILIITDNGRGFKQSKTDTLGLNLINNLVNKQLKGIIGITSKQGVKVEIKWESYG